MKGDHSRRAFLQLGSGAAFSGLSAGWLLPGAAFAHAALARVQPGSGSDLGPGLGFGFVLGPGRVQEEAGFRYYLSALDLDSAALEPVLLETGFYGHGLALDPTRASRAVLFEKRGAGACEVDLARGEVVRPITTDGREFYGHGAFSPDGAMLFATETVVEDDYRGVIVVRDGKTFEELGEFPTYGASPHDCVLRDGGKTLVVTNGGSRTPGGIAPSVTYVDVPTQKLVERVEFANDEITAGHLALSRAGDLAVVSAAREWMSRESLGAASFRPAGRSELLTMETPRPVTARMRGETLSVAIHEESGVVGVTNPTGNLVTFWDLVRGRWMASLNLAFPRGIALTQDASNFIISYGKSTSLLFVDPATLQPVPGSRRSSLVMSGSHIVSHSLTID